MESITIDIDKENNSAEDINMNHRDMLRRLMIRCESLIIICRFKAFVYKLISLGIGLFVIISGAITSSILASQEEINIVLLSLTISLTICQSFNELFKPGNRSVSYKLATVNIKRILWDAKSIESTKSAKSEESIYLFCMESEKSLDEIDLELFKNSGLTEKAN